MDVSFERLDTCLHRSDELDAVLVEILEPEGLPYEAFDDSKRITASVAACKVSLEHARALRLLIASGHPTSAISVLRLQYEAVTRAVWLLYAAPDNLVDKLQADLSVDSEKAANAMPVFSEMLASLEGRAPADACTSLQQFKKEMWRPLNSYVHIGIHPLQRSQTGYPVALLEQVLHNSNGVLTMAAMMFSILSGNAAIAKSMRGVQSDFADCLPPLLVP